MLLTIHDANLQKIGFIDNEKQETLNFYDDTWTRSLETASSTFEFTVSKKELLGDTANQPLYNQLNERSFISFKHNGQTYLFNIMKVEENERWVRCYCENLNLELINEYTNAYKADKAMSFAEYLNAFDIPQFAMVTLGVNEVSDQKKTLEWEGQDTKLARLLSLANKFNAEVEFVTRLNDDSSIKQLVLNVYHQADDSHTGVGRIRSDICLMFEKNIKSMTRKVDKTEIYTMIVPYGKAKEQAENGPEARVYIGGLPAWEEKNDKGIVIFKQEGNCLYAPHAANLYPSTFGASTQDNKWIRKDLEVDSDDPKVIRAAGIANLRKNAYPAITYEVDGFVDVEIGDTITIHDKGFVPSLDVRARAIEQKISFSNPANNTTIFGNFKELENRTSGDLRTVFERMVENSRPYSILFSTDNGVIFKNNTGQSTLRPTLKRGNQTVNATYRFVIDGSIVGAGLTYTVSASKITKPTVITVSAWVGEKEVASDEITFVGVSDGLNGQDGVGLVNTTLRYAKSTDGVNKPSGGVVANFPNEFKPNRSIVDNNITTDLKVRLEQGKTYILSAETNGTFTNQHNPNQSSDNATIWLVNPSFSTWAVISDGNTANGTRYTHNRPTGEYNIRVNGYKADNSTWVKNIVFEDGTWSPDIPTVNPGEYLWTRTTWFYSDGTNEQGYSVAKTGEQGPIGGENLIRNSAFPENLDNWGYWEVSQPNSNLSVSSHSFYYNGSKPMFLLKTASPSPAATGRFPVKRNTDYSLNVSILAGGNLKGIDIYFLGRKSNETKTFSKVVNIKHFDGSPSTSSVSKFHFTFNAGECDEGFIRVDNTGTTDGSQSLLFFTELDCYEGTTDRAWQASPKDLASQLDSKADSALTQSQLNRLNEINSVMKSELEAKASLDTLNQWVKAYRDFVNANNANRAQAEKNLADASARVAKLENNLNDMSERWNFIDSYMASSNEGLVIGKADNSSSMLFSPNGRISMFSAGNEVMYISQGVIHIENGIFSKTIQIGRYREEQDFINPDRNVIRYVGGS